MRGGLEEATGYGGKGSRCPQHTRETAGLLHKVGSLLSLKGQGGLEQWGEVWEDLGPVPRSGARELWVAKVLGVLTTSTQCPQRSPKRQVVLSSYGAPVLERS